VFGRAAVVDSRQAFLSFARHHWGIWRELKNAFQLNVSEKRRENAPTNKQTNLKQANLKTCFCLFEGCEAPLPNIYMLNENGVAEVATDLGSLAH
jgi:hypothetical protein